MARLHSLRLFGNALLIVEKLMCNTNLCFRYQLTLSRVVTKGIHYLYQRKFLLKVNVRIDVM